MKYTKPALSIDDQVALLMRRGMRIPEPDRARHHLLHLSYYRLRGYWLPLEHPANGGDHQFISGTQFEDALSLYLLDRHLRLWLMDMIERVEVALRAKWAHAMSMRHGPHSYLDTTLFRDPVLHARCLESLEGEVGRSQETFIKHSRTKYTDPSLPPAWVACEVMTLGQLSRWIANLKHRGDREAVLAGFGVDEAVLCSFLHHLTHVRNLCAHHCRVWNRRLTVTMKIPKHPRTLAEMFNRGADRKIYNTTVMLGHMIGIISPESQWRRHLLDLLAEHSKAEPLAMGFPTHWQRLSIWGG